MIVGFHSSFNDYENKTALICFTQGCNFNCWWCSNSQLKDKKCEEDRTEDMLKHLADNLDFYEAIIISGGEPTIWGNKLISLLSKLRSLDSKLLIKLDTNGSNPNIVKTIVNGGLVDIIAMDIKQDLSNFHAMSEVIGKKYDSNLRDSLLKSIDCMMKHSKIKKIFRTTFIPGLNEINFVNIYRYLESVWSENCEFHIQKFDPSIAVEKREENEPEALTKSLHILDSYGFKYKLKNF